MLKRRQRFSLADARQAGRSCCSGIPAKVNLLPFNPWPGSPVRVLGVGGKSRALRRQSSTEAGYASPVRTPRGRDIMAACGQLKSAAGAEAASA